VGPRRPGHRACRIEREDDRLPGDFRRRPHHRAGVRQMPSRGVLRVRAIGEIAHRKRCGVRRCGQEQQHHRRHSRELEVKIHGSAGDPFKRRASDRPLDAAALWARFAAVVIEVAALAAQSARDRWTTFLYERPPQAYNVVGPAIGAGWLASSGQSSRLKQGTIGNRVRTPARPRLEQRCRANAISRHCCSQTSAAGCRRGVDAPPQLRQTLSECPVAAAAAAMALILNSEWCNRR
jgi:hypothetical protein